MMTDHMKIARDLTAARAASPELFDTAEGRTREALAWAIPETVLRVPPSLRSAAAWRWDADDAALVGMSDEGEFRFHVAAERNGRGKTRIAVLSVINDNGKATWDAQMPPSRV
jgi:hypothetical protein